MTKKFLVPVVLPADPSVAMEAATKQYVDSKASGGMTPAQVYGERANQVVSGGGVLTYNFERFRWSQRFIVMGAGRDPALALDGYFDINMPPPGTTVTGLGGASNSTVDSNGIYLSAWSSLYYEAPLGYSSASVAGNFKVVGYTTGAFSIPPHWVLLAVQNAEQSALWVPPGIGVKYGTSYDPMNPPAIPVTLQYGLRANQMLTGDGSVTFTASRRLKWSNRWIVISRGVGTYAPDGYFQITMPPQDYMVTGVGGAANVYVDAEGIPITTWSSLYYALPFTGGGTAMGAFYLMGYGSGYDVPPEWVLLAQLNDEGAGGKIWIQPGGIPMKPGTTYVHGDPVRQLSVTDLHVAAANKDGAAGTPSMRTLGTGALQATAGGTTVLKTGDTMTGSLTMPNQRLGDVYDGSGSYIGLQRFPVGNTTAAGPLLMWGSSAATPHIWLISSLNGNITLRPSFDPTKDWTLTTSGMTASTMLTLNGGGNNTLSLKPGTADHAYMQFFARTGTPTIRSAYLGIPGAAQTGFAIVNEMVNGAMTLGTNGTGRVSVSADPTAALNVATKQYVDNKIGFTYSQDAAPTATAAGQTWYQTSTGNSFVWTSDGTSSQWVQFAPGSGGGGGGTGRIAYAQVVTAQGGIGTNNVDIGGLSVTFSAILGRSYKFTAFVYLAGANANSSASLTLFTGGGTQVTSSIVSMPGASVPYRIALEWVASDLSGAQTFKLATKIESGTTLQVLAGSNYPSHILVEDITYGGGGGNGCVQMTQAQYNAIAPGVPGILYVIVG